ncbi:MAG TPA: proteasome ATPase [Actinomycetota bacterium]|nr:proteasome ATPase [Actinomycetota bacterium]
MEVPTDDVDPKIAQFDQQVQELRGQVKLLEEELALSRRKLDAAPRQMRSLEERLYKTGKELEQAHESNDRIANTLREAREQLVALKEAIEKLTQPPSSYGVFLEGFEEESTADVFTNGRKLRVHVSPELKLGDLQRGQEVMLNEALNVIEAFEFEIHGEVVTLKEKLEDGKRALVIARADEERVIELADSLIDQKLRAGDSLLMDAKSGLAIERLPKPEVEELILEEVPDISYEDIGGLDGQIEEIRDAVELPFLHGDLFREHKLEPPKGILLYGPPGCGKTLVAKAVANSLAKKVAEKLDSKHKSYFLNIKGPELLNKYVGETERQIRLIFQRAKEKSEEGVPVIVFFDEMDSLFRTRGSGISSDIESTIVPQLLAEIDGVESLKNVIVIGASNREDLIDPAILRPGRLDVKIKIERPDERSAKDIFGKYLTSDIPISQDEVRVHGSEDKAIEVMVEATVERMYADEQENRFLEVTYANGDKEELYFKDFSSGAMIENIVRRAKKTAIKRAIAGEPKGINQADLLTAIYQEYRENEDLPNTTNPDDWARVSGKKGERIVYIRTLVTKRDEDEGEGARQVERVQTGQYL